MAYTLSTTKIDQITLSGTFVTSGRKWAHVFHGVQTGGAGAITSATLLGTISAAFQANANPILPLLSSDVQLTDAKARQVAAWKAKYGRVAQISMTLVGGVVTAPVVLDGGSGYSAPLAQLSVFDPSGSGAGAVLVPIFTGDAISGVTLTSGGAGYGPFSVIVATLPTVAPKTNRKEVTYGPNDFLAVGPTLGGVATDRQPAFNAWSLKGRSAVVGRAGRTSAHLPGVPEVNTLADALTGGARAAMQTAATLFYTVPFVLGGGPTYTLMTFSPTQWFKWYPLFGLSSVSTFVAGPITTMQVNLNVGSELRRKLKI